MLATFICPETILIDVDTSWHTLAHTTFVAISIVSFSYTFETYPLEGTDNSYTNYTINKDKAYVCTTQHK